MSGKLSQFEMGLSEVLKWGWRPLDQSLFLATWK